ncbi:phage major capsid protein [Tepidanaerobacter syntrophicus]|uniref:phage major capsid protein n=1 Tax=Tepidanaerobacter syntrophicus TaxID=224999 RepID=UPI001BD69A96|nr:phage major capsid protein [Tepidanaerobacter syntrophicus]
MNIEKRLKEINDRKLEIRQLLEDNSEADLDAIEKELGALDKEAQELRSKKETAEKIQTGEAEIRKIEQPEVEKMDNVFETQEYRNAFFKKLLGKPLNEAEERAYTSADASAGAVIPTQTANMIFEKMVKIAPMLNQITLLRVAGNVKFAIEGVHDAAALHQENTAITPANDTLVYVTLAGYEYAKVIRISKTVATMAINAFETWLVNMLAEDIAKAIEDDIINGTGTNEPKGIEKANTWTDGTNAILVDTDATPAEALDFDDIMDLIALLPNGYMSNAKFLCNSRMFYGTLTKLKDADGHPIYVKDMENGVGFRIMGFPVILSDYVANNTLYFGDFSKVVGNLSQDIVVESSTQSGFLSNAIDFRGTAIFDCDIALPEAFRKLYVGTSL